MTENRKCQQDGENEVVQIRWLYQHKLYIARKQMDLPELGENIGMYC